MWQVSDPTLAPTFLRGHTGVLVSLLSLSLFYIQTHTHTSVYAARLPPSIYWITKTHFLYVKVMISSVLPTPALHLGSLEPNFHLFPTTSAPLSLSRGCNLRFPHSVPSAHFCTAISDISSVQTRVQGNQEKEARGTWARQKKMYFLQRQY